MAPSGERPPTEALIDRALRAAFTAGPAPVPGRLPDDSLPSDRAARIESEIARGGMGVVYRAHDPSLERDVALKLLREDLVGDPAAVRRFLEEARIGGRLQHPGVVPVYALGRTPTGRPWFTMKLIEGRTLAALLAERDSPEHDLRRFLSILESISRTVAYAHDRGVLHLDLKPSNVMVGAFGEVQVVDWGLAALVRSGDARVREGSVYGTPAYMPPEQARGETARIDERADVFALGAILCEILTGDPPWRGGREAKRTDAADARFGDAIARLERAGAPNLAEVASACLAVEPADRRKSAGEIASEIARHFATLEERARRAEIVAAEARERASQAARARRLTVALAGSVLLTILLGVAIATWLGLQRGQRRKSVDARASLALEEAARLLGQAESSSDAETFERAATAAARAQEVLAGGEGSPNLGPDAVALLARIRSSEADARARAQRDRADRALLAALDALRVPDDEFDEVERDRRYSEAFRAAGMDPDAGSPEAFAAEARARGTAVAIAAAFDEWVDVRARACLLSGADRLRAIARALDPDPIRVEVRRRLAAGDADAIVRLADGEDLSGLLPGTFHALGRSTKDRTRVGPEDPIRIYRIAHRAHPEDPTIAVELARLLYFAGNPTEGEHFYRIALALRPDDARIHQELAWELDHLDIDHAAAVELDLRAVELAPEDFVSHFCLGRALRNLGDLDGACAAQEVAARLLPGDTRPHKELALIHRLAGDPERSLLELEKVLSIAPYYAIAREEHAKALAERGRIEEALAEVRRGMETDLPALGRWEQLEGLILLEHGDWEEAARILRGVALEPHLAVLPLFERGSRLSDFLDLDRLEAECARWVERFPTDPESRCRLGVVLAARGRCGEALVELRTGNQLGARQQGWERPSGAWLADAERMAAIERKLDAFLAGTLEVTDPADLRDLGILAARKGLAEPAARCFSAAFERDPACAAKPGARLEAACAAVRAGSAAWRARALTWLREEIAGPGRTGPWRIARELEPVRDPAALEALPAEERDAWRAAWDLARR